MKYIFKKYEFETQELAETRIAALPHTEVDGESHPSHSHTVVKLGYIFTEQLFLFLLILEFRTRIF